ncbi:hypothetical protein S100892_00939 [Pediococcus pentosaceus]|uniref:Uncharacterized protein n=1 Tax=Pediococcus pentosaceus TaxID=1255 RepID=A0A1Y0VS76_PEDPE|nr:hypothetical protein S100892_00939 [Pediococcus pentosaceus]
MDILVQQWHKKSVQLWATLVALILIIFLLRDFMSQILLVVIFPLCHTWEFKRLENTPRLVSQLVQ